MEQALAPTSARSVRHGRIWLWAGVVLCLLGIPLYLVQLRLRLLFTPWYTPVLATLGIICLVIAWRLQRSIWRVATIFMFALLTGFEWHFLLSYSRLPDYTGPARVGEQVPAFMARRSNGEPFTEKDLTGEPTALVLFRGRW
jgi:hypothetical protein